MESVTCTANANEPAATGLPVILPEAASRVRPGGIAPEVVENTYGGTPPVADTASEYCAPVLPDDSVVVEMLTPVVTVKLHCRAAVRFSESVASTAICELPAWVAVPEIVPER